MIFGCGPTREERDRRAKEWHRFFPLFPRTVRVVDGECFCAWLEPIERRAIAIYYWPERCVYWEYRALPQNGGVNGNTI